MLYPKKSITHVHHVQYCRSQNFIAIARDHKLASGAASLEKVYVEAWGEGAAMQAWPYSLPTLVVLRQLIGRSPDRAPTVVGVFRCCGW